MNDEIHFDNRRNRERDLADQVLTRFVDDPSLEHIIWGDGDLKILLARIMERIMELESKGETHER